MTLFIPAHGVELEIAGRIYKHVPSPIRKHGASDDVLLKVHSGQWKPFLSKARFRCVVAGRRWGKCLAKGTLVTMADGSVKPVEQVKAGDLVMTVNEDSYVLEAKSVQHLHDNGVRDTLIVKTPGRDIRCTPNHPLLVNNRWTEAQHIRAGDLVAVPRQTPFGSEGMPGHEIDLLAIWLAEGSESHISNTTPAILDALREALGKFDCDLVHIKGPDWRWRRRTQYVAKGRGAGDEGKKSEPRKFLERMGVWGLTSKTKFIPDAVFRLPEDQLARFLNLFFACDGAICRRLEMQLANERMVRQISDLLLKFGIRGSVRRKVHGSVGRDGTPFVSWRYMTARRDDIVSFANRIGAMSKEAQIVDALAAATESSGSSNDYLPISHDSFVGQMEYEAIKRGRFGGYNCAVSRDLPDDLRDSLKSWRKQDSSRCSKKRFASLRKYSDGFFDNLADGGVVWEEVKSVEAAGEVQTYDLTISDNHNFIANGIVTHNTHWTCIELIRAATQKEKQKIWYVAPTYSMAKQIAWEKLKEIIPRSWIARTPMGTLAINETALSIRLVNNSTISLKGADRPDTLRGVGVHFLVLDEYQDMKKEVWTALRPTLSDTLGRCIFIGTPKSYNHLYDMYQRGQKNAAGKKNPQWESWQFKTSHSPFIAPSELEEAKKDLDVKTYRQEYEASFESMSGRIYYDFDRTKNVMPCPFDPSLPTIVGQDFNVDPMSSIILQRHGDQLWATGELSLRSSSTEDVCSELLKEYGWGFKDLATIYPDPSGNNRSSARGESDIQIFREWGFNRILFKPKAPLVRDRIAAVNRLICSAAGERKLFVDPSCKELITSLEQMIYKVERDGTTTNEPDKSSNIDHMADALGYPVDYEFPVRKTFKAAGYSH